MTTVTSDLEQLRRRSRNRRLLGLFVKRIVILREIVIVLAPGYFIVLASLQPGSSFFSGTLLPRNSTWRTTGCCSTTPSSRPGCATA